MQLIRLTRSDTGHSELTRETQITVNSEHILMIQETHEKENGNSRIVLTNGKNLYVEETQDDIRNMANL